MRAITALLLAGLFAAFAGCSPHRQLKLSPCHLKGLPEEVYCGSLTVFENRDTQQGRTIAIQIAVLPALRRSGRPDAVMVMAGGPGQGARAYAPLIARSFRAIRRTRDVVLVDLRGTGGSKPLDCPPPDDELDTLTDLLFANSRESGAERAVAECLSALDADPRQFTHAQSLADLDDVQRALGYEQVNLWGGSWGTRAALLYSLWHPERVRSVVLDGAVPLSMDFPASASADAQRALDLLLEDCESDPACRTTFPELQREVVGRILTRVATGASVTVRHPRTDAVVAVTLTRAAFVEILRASLYSPATVSRLPQVLGLAAGGDFGPLLAQWLEIASGTTETMALGATLAVLCSEDVTNATLPASDDSTSPVFGTGYADFWISRCRRWPKGLALPRDVPGPLAMPALILSGALDPVTPPHWGEVMARTFARSVHVVVPGAGHNASFSGCVPELIALFYESADPAALDASCVEAVRRPPFALSSAGSQP